MSDNTQDDRNPAGETLATNSTKSEEATTETSTGEAKAGDDSTATSEDSNSGKSKGADSRRSRSKTSGADAKRSKMGLVAKLFVVVLGVAVVVGGIVWWRELQLGEAEAALDEGDYKYALFVADEYLKNSPDNSQALSIRARALMGQRTNPEEVLDIFDRIGAATAEEMHVWAQACLMKSLWTQALPLLQQSAEMTPGDADILYELSICRIRLGRTKEALESAEQLAQIPGNEARGQLLLGTVHDDLGNVKDAVAAMATVLKFEPDAQDLQVPDYDVFANYGRMLISAGQSEQALEPLKRSVAIHPTAGAFVSLGNAASELGRPLDAERAWVEAVRYDPPNVEARTALANAALEASKPEEALEWVKPYEPDPEIPFGIAYLLQRCYTALDDEEAAKKWTEKTTQLRKDRATLAALNQMITDNPNAFWSRAARTHQYADKGNWEQAESMLPQLLKDAPGEPFIIELANAVKNQTELPDIKRIPLSIH